MKGRACSFAIAALALGACGPSPDATRRYFAAAIDRYYREHCVTIDPGVPDAFPLGVALRDTARLARFDALAAAGLLSASDTAARASLLDVFQDHLGRHRPAPLPARRYALTDLGRRMYHSGEGFCAATYRVAEVQRYAEPDDARGYLAAQVFYTYAIGDVRPWTQDAHVRQAFPELSTRLDAAPREGSATLMLTYDGWVHERDFTRF